MSTVVYVILGEFPQGVTADTISELTSGSGVTIDSVLLKDGQVDLADDKKVLLGTGDDGELYVNGDNVYIRNVTADKDIIFSVLDGAAQTTMMTLDADVPQVDFGNIAVVNVGAAGNDFGASNSLVATTLSGDIAMGGNNVTNVGTITGEASTASLILVFFVLPSTPKSAPGPFPSLSLDEYIFVPSSRTMQVTPKQSPSHPSAFISLLVIFRTSLIFRPTISPMLVSFRMLFILIESPGGKRV